MNKNPIMVTGVTGYLASWIVKYLLEEGHTVHGTLRSLARAEKYAHLRKAEKNTNGKLVLFEADLLDEGSFEDAMTDCEVVIHTASPFTISGIKDPINSLIKPAQEGTKNVLEQVNLIPTVKRVVITSSVVAIYGDASELKESGTDTFDESFWNTTSSTEHQPYPYSKTLAEREAWKIFESQKRWSMAVLNPGFIMGPSLTQYTKSTSFEVMSQMGNGQFKMGVPKLYFGVVDVRDVARAHVIAALDNNVSGRNILVKESLDFLAMSKILQNKFGKDYPFPKSYLPKFLVWLVGPTQGLTRKYVNRNVGIPVAFKNDKSINDLGITYHPMEKTITEHFQQLIDDKLV